MSTKEMFENLDWYLDAESNENEIVYGKDIQNFKKDYKVYFSLINDLRVSKAKIEEILQKYKEIIGIKNE